MAPASTMPQSIVTVSDCPTRPHRGSGGRQGLPVP
jgi:hypothetical protein